MNPVKMLRCVFFVSVVLCFGGMSHVAGAKARPQPAKAAAAETVLPVLCGGVKEVRVVVGLNEEAASTQLEFCAPGKEKTTTAKLTAGDFASRMTKLELGAKVLFSLPEKETGNASLALAAIEQGKVLLVKAELTKIWEAGEAEATLRINGAEVGKLVAVKYRLPFGVKLDAADPDKPEITLQRNQGHDFVLKNEDGVTYEIEWEFDVAGKTVRGKSVVTPNSTAKFIVWPEWPGSLTGWLKDHEEEGKLTLSFRPPGVANAKYWPSKVIKVKVKMRYTSEGWRAVWGNTILLLVLVAGAMFSYLGAVGMPNRLKRSDYQESLTQLAQRIGGISHQVDSRLRVVVRVQRKRLFNQLWSRANISPDLTRVFNRVSQGLAALVNQVSLAEQIDAAHRRLKLLDAKGAPPSLLAAAEDTVWKAAEEISHIGPEDQELKLSREYLGKARDCMDKAENLNEEFAKGLPKRAREVQTALTPYLLTPLFTEKIQPALRGVFANLAPPAKAPETLEAAADLDANLTKRDLVRQFLEIYNATGDEQARADLDLQLGRLLRTLGLKTYKAVRHARRLVREAQEGIYPADIAQGAATASIEVDPAMALANEPARFSVRFGDPSLNDAAARLEFEGRWDFGHDGYTERGWDPLHYFPRSGEFPLAFEFQGRGDKGANVVRGKVKVLEIDEKWWEQDRNRAELVRFFVTLAPATIGLLSGAREQLLKMDVFPALLAVFLLGFSSDTIKNLVSQSQQAPAPAAPPAAEASPPAAAGEPAANPEPEEASA